MTDVTQFRAVSTLDSIVFCSQVEEIEGKTRMWFPYLLNIQPSEEQENGHDVQLMSFDPWNPEDFVDIKSEKIDFMTPISPEFSHVFEKIVCARKGSKSSSDTEALPSNVVLLDRKKFN